MIKLFETFAKENQLYFHTGDLEDMIKYNDSKLLNNHHVGNFKYFFMTRVSNDSYHNGNTEYYDYENIDKNGKFKVKPSHSYYLKFIKPANIFNFFDLKDIDNVIKNFKNKKAIDEFNEIINDIEIYNDNGKEYFLNSKEPPDRDSAEFKENLHKELIRLGYDGLYMSESGTIILVYNTSKLKIIKKREYTEKEIVIKKELNKIINKLETLKPTIKFYNLKHNYHIDSSIFDIRGYYIQSKMDKFGKFTPIGERQPHNLNSLTIFRNYEYISRLKKSIDYLIQNNYLVDK
jgi:hypothetical protein